ncbi:MAG: hypothetical protein ACK4RK_21700 [Gemmataceae bacterium]
MNLLCPICQKMLQVSDQFAGQLMKCPLCGGSFTVPTLPPAPGAAAPPPPTPTTPPPVPGPPAGAGHAATPSPAAPEPVKSASVSAPAPTGYTHSRTCVVNPRVLPWVILGSLVLIFILMFFPWVGMYPAGVGVGSQNAWEVAFGMFSCDTEWESVVGFQCDNPDNQPGLSVFVLFYVLLFLLLLIPLAVASTLIKLMPIKLPPPVMALLPWRSALVAGLAALGLLFLLFQLLLGFSLSNKIEEVSEKAVEAQRKTDKKELVDFRKGQRLAQFNVQTTTWLRLVLLLNVIVIAGAGLDFWLERRGDKPLPRMDVHW